jgi:hypothetical protein
MNDLQKEEWMNKNIDACNAFEQYALQIAETGKKFGFKAVAERVRWQTYFSKTCSSFKWSNSITTFAGRKFIEKYPMFENQVSFKEFKSYGNVK